MPAPQHRPVRAGARRLDTEHFLDRPDGRPTDRPARYLSFDHCRERNAEIPLDECERSAAILVWRPGDASATEALDGPVLRRATESPDAACPECSRTARHDRWQSIRPIDRHCSTCRDERNAVISRSGCQQRAGS